jgi:hypothetical protein
LWLVRRLFNRMRSREPLPGSLITAELWGALHAPWAYFATRRQARERALLPLTNAPALSAE